MADHAALERSDSDGITTLRFGRGRGARVDLACLEALEATLRDVAEDTSVRVLRLRSRGDEFSHGADLSDPRLVASIVGGDASRRALASLGQRVVDALAALPVPTVVDVSGRAIGAGACFVAACDLRVAAPDASIAFPEVDRGMHLGWGILPRLTRWLGPGPTAQLALLGDTLPVRALPAGSVVLADAPGEAADALARRLADKPAHAVRAIVASLREGHAEHDVERFAQTVADPGFAAAMARFLGG